MDDRHPLGVGCYEGTCLRCNDRHDALIAAEEQAAPLLETVDATGVLADGQEL